jgi:hypothetical protein
MAAALDRNKKSLGFRRLRNSSEPVCIHRPRGGEGSDMPPPRKLNSSCGLAPPDRTIEDR